MPIAIDKPSKYFNTITYTGDGASTKAITVGFQPDFVWIKDRTTAYDHHLFDAVRGGGNSLYSNDSVAENTYTTDITFDSNGFTTAGVGSAAILYVNKSGDAFASWNWKANGAGVSNTSGSITSTVSANTTSGFSIISYTGTGTTSQTVGHGLGVAPAMIIIKNRSAVTDWRVYHKSLGVNGSYPNFLELDLTTASNTGDSGNFASVPTSSVFGVGNYNVVNGNGNSMIAYCFAEVKGFSKFGSYTGNSNADGTFVYTGFKPAFIMVKATNGVEAWFMLDNKRANTFNAVNGRLRANGFDAEETNVVVCDFVSNGFKFRFSDGGWNSSSYTYIYMAFSESPFVSSKGICTTAR